MSVWGTDEANISTTYSISNKNDIKVRKVTYKLLKEHYEGCLAEHGEGHKACDWPNKEDTIARHIVMAEIKTMGPDSGFSPSVIDFGCGLGAFCTRAHIMNMNYTGVDISPEFIKKAKELHPEEEFHCLDITACPDAMPRGDYIVCNGVWTEKQSLSFDEMWSWVQDTMIKLWGKCDVGLAANFMTPFVTTEQREDLFHLPVDTLMEFCCKNITRNIVVRHDYLPWEYTVYIYR